MKIEIADMARPDSDCELRQSMGISMFLGLCKSTNNNPCNGCSYNPCPLAKKVNQKAADIRKNNFGKHAHKTNAEIAKEISLKVGREFSARQISKMRKRGELDDLLD